MLRISKKGDYGLLLVTALARLSGKAYTPLRVLARDQQLPYKFISQIALELRDAGILESKEGLGGGYKLAKKPIDISVQQILTTLDGPIAPVGCMRGKTCCNSETCSHKGMMNKLAQIVTQTMQSYTVADLVKV